jgi:hypothetical protein
MCCDGLEANRWTLEPVHSNKLASIFSPELPIQTCRWGVLVCLPWIVTWSAFDIRQPNWTTRISYTGFIPLKDSVLLNVGIELIAKVGSKRHSIQKIRRFICLMVARRRSINFGKFSDWCKLPFCMIQKREGKFGIPRRFKQPNLVSQLRHLRYYSLKFC